MAAKKKTRTMSDEHKAALAEGRAQGRAVRLYLEAIEANKPKLEKLVVALLEKETLDAVEVTEILGPRPQLSPREAEIMVPPPVAEQPLIGEPISTGTRQE